MKTPLLTVLSGIAFFTLVQTPVFAQPCSVTNPVVSNIQISSAGSSCIATLDLSFNQSNNGGNKWTTVHLWTSANYPNLTSLYAAGTAPTTANVPSGGTPLGTIVINNSTLAFNSKYQQDNNFTIVTQPTSTLSVTTVNSSTNKYTITGVKLTLPSSVCSGSAVTIKGDVWSANAAQNQNVGCYSQGLTITANDPAVTGTVLCNNPRQFTVNISTVSASAEQAMYTVYADANSSGTFDISDPAIYSTSSPVTIPAAGTGSYSSSAIDNASYPNANLWTVATVTNHPINSVGQITNPCAFISLPVKLLSFNAGNSGSLGVLLTWQTATETNDKGFEVQRKSGAGDFQPIGFVSSLAPDGSSATPLSYQYDDQSPSGGPLQYRLAQTDLDGKVQYSTIVGISREATAGSGLIIYPNPAPGGHVTLQFDHADRRDISIFDASGRVVRIIHNITDNTCPISNLRTGIYFLKVTTPANGETQQARLIVL